MGWLKAWRITKKRHSQSAFSGEAAFQYGSRWNSPGTRVVYLASNQALAALEVLVNTEDKDDLVRIPYVLIAVEFDEDWVKKPDELPEEWAVNPAPLSAARVGDRWVKGNSSALLEVPSAVIPTEKNFLLNPVHPDFKKVKIGTPKPFGFDPRAWS
jgi:RES domain-containing protein